MSAGRVPPMAFRPPQDSTSDAILSMDRYTPRTNLPAVWLLCPFAGCLLFVAGCGDKEDIRTYTVPKPSVIAKSNPPVAVKRDPTAVAPAKRPSAASPLTYKTPEGWRPGQSGAMRAAAFEVVDGDKKLEITAITLPNSGLLENVNRWRNQVHIEPLTDEQLKAATKKVPVGLLSGDFVEMVGADDEKRPDAILGVIVAQSDRAWFFKLKGDPELAAREKDKFLAFVQSVKFDGAEQTEAADGK